MSSGYKSDTLSNPPNPGHGGIRYCHPAPVIHRYMKSGAPPEDIAALRPISIEFQILNGRHTEAPCVDGIDQVQSRREARVLEPRLKKKEG